MLKPLMKNTSLGRPLTLEERVKRLFVGYDGALYINDTSTMYTTSTGSAPVASNDDPVGLLIDQSRGGEGNQGAELVENGHFNDDLAGWSSAFGTISWESGKLRVTEDSDGLGARARMVINTVAGNWYKLTVEVTKGVGASATDVSAVNGTNYSYGTNIGRFAVAGSGTATLFFRAESGTTSLLFASGAAVSGNWFEIDNVSCKYVPGNHAYQATASARPLYKVGSGHSYIDYDNIDDLHNIVFLASLGSDVTVAYSYPGAGTTVLTGQTIGTGTTIDTDASGYLILSRPLIAGETQLVTAYLNDLSGD